MVGDGNMCMLAIAASWNRLAHGIVDSENCESFRHQTLLRTAYQDSMRLFSEQNAMQSNRTFLERVGTVAAKMPLFRELLVGDGANITEQAPEQVLDYFRLTITREELEQDLSKFSTYRWKCGGAEDGERMPPVSILHKLPGTLHKAGVFLAFLQITIHNPRDLNLLEPNEEDSRDWKVAMQRLKAFDFTLPYHGCSHGSCHSWSTIDCLHKFMALVLGAQY